MRYNSRNSILPILWMAIFIKTLLIGVAYVVPVDMLHYLGKDSVNDLIHFSPEIWLSLMAFVFGTLIIVVSIASEKTPKLIDLFVTEYWSCLFIWLIALSSMENIFLQFLNLGEKDFIDNMFFMNNYIFLPCFIIAAIPYIFYILKYTKSSSVIERIFENNLRAIREAGTIKSPGHIDQNHFVLLESVNQLHDLLQYIEFKEPQADIIHRLGRSLRYYLAQKPSFCGPYFRIGSAIKNDVSFSALSDRYIQIQSKKTFYEEKILRVLGTSYLLLIRDSHHDLASLCGNELFKTGKAAIELEDHHVTDAVIIYFNTMLRFGINNGIKAREIRNIYNAIFHYSQFVEFLIEKRQDERIIQCCRYFRFYASEIRKVSLSEPIFFFLVEAFAVEIKKILIAMHTQQCPRELQSSILDIFNELSSQEKKHRKRDNGLRLIQVALSLFYIKNNEREFYELIIDAMVKDLADVDRDEAIQLIKLFCRQLEDTPEDFWEETDQGSQNIYYSQDKSELPKFLSCFSSKLFLTDKMVSTSN